MTTSTRVPTSAPIDQHDLALDPITQQVVRVLSDMGIIFPTPISSSEIKQFPLDITAVSLMELGELHSYWTAIQARDSGVHGMVIAHKRSLKFQIAKIKPLLTQGTDQSKEQARLRLHELEQQFARVDAMDAIMDSTVDAHKRYADACSREISRRQIEASLSR